MSVFVVVDYSIPVGRACGASVWFAFNSLRAFNCCRDGHYSHGLDVPDAHSASPPTGPEQASAGGWPGGGQGPLCIPCWQTSPALRRGCLDGAAQVSMQSAHSSSISSPPLLRCFLPGSKPCDLTYNISVIMNRVLWQRKIMQLAHGWVILLLLFLAAFFLEASLVIWIDLQYQYKRYEQGVTAEENNSMREGNHGGSIVLEKELLWGWTWQGLESCFFPCRSGNAILCRGAKDRKCMGTNSWKAGLRNLEDEWRVWEGV